MVAEQDIAVLPWQEVIPEIASYIKLDKGSNLIFQAILIFLILFTIFNTILMSVLEREREFAVLLALGTKPVQLRLQILMESAYLGLIGCALGLLVGGLAAWAAQVWGIDLRSLLGRGVYHLRLCRERQDACSGNHRTSFWYGRTRLWSYINPKSLSNAPRHPSLNS